MKRASNIYNNNNSNNREEYVAEIKKKMLIEIKNMKRTNNETKKK